jgi:hypothetical protein
MTKMITKKCQKMPINFICENCDFSCSKLSNYNKHLLTLKHQNSYTELQKMPKMPESERKNICDCGKEYKYRQGLYTHRKKCGTEKKNADKNNSEVTELTTIIVEMVKNNNDLQKQVLDVCKNIQPNISNNNNNNNNTFNLQFFLNEQCKDAMNITDFINSVTLSLTDLENMGTSGYVNGISSIIIKELRGLDITKRPVHCSDAKRETLYIKDEDKWEKECPENTKMKTAIRTVEKKNIKLISEWTDKHPKFTNSTTKENDEYLQILIETMGGKGDYEKNKNKVIKNIAKEVVIDK